MSTYRVFLASRASADDLLELPRNGLTYGWTLDNAGTAGLSQVVSTHPSISGGNASRLESWASELLIVRDQDSAATGMTGPLWWGPIVGPSGDSDTKQATISAREPAAWFARRGWYTDIDLSAWDSADAARHVITARTTALGPAGDLGITLAPTKSGQRGPNVLKASDRLRLSAVVDQCGNVGDGFDWTIVPVQDRDGTYRREWRVYPGGRGILVGMTIAQGRGGLRAFSRSSAGDGIATRVYHPRTDSQGRVSYGYAQADLSTELRYGIHELDDNEGDAPGNDTTAAARATLGYRRPPVPIMSFSYQVSEATPLGLVMPGDTVPIDVQGSGWPDYTGTGRVVGVTVTVGESGRETVACSLQAPPGGIS